MTFDARHSVDKGLYHLAGRLDPIIDSKLRSSMGGLPWPTILTELDKMRGKPPKTYVASDLQSQLKVITERLGKLGFPFDDHTRLVTALGSELRIVRNRWAHHDELTTLDAWRAHDFVVRLLEHFGDDEGADEAKHLRDRAFVALADEKDVAVHAARAGLEPPTADAPSAAGSAVEAEIVRPDPAMLERPSSTATPTIGSSRSEFQPWKVVVVGDVSVLDDLPKKVAKETVRAVATEIAEFEGPIHIGRLAQLIAASFGVQRLYPARERKLAYQIRQTGLVVDDDRFVWPSDTDAKTWAEFRPNDSTVERPFTEISPVEIANVMRLQKSVTQEISDGDLDAATLQTFGRKRKTKQIGAHLARARAVL